MRLKKEKTRLERHNIDSPAGSGPPAIDAPLDLAAGVREALDVLRTRGKVIRCRHADGSVFYKFNGKIVNSIEIMRLAGMTREGC